MCSDYIEFVDRGDIEHWILQNQLSLTDVLDIEYANAYTRTEEFNSKIRNDITLTYGQAQLDEYLGNILTKFKCPNNIIVYRGISKKAFKSMIKAAGNAFTLGKPKTALEKAYMSTSLRQSRTLNSEIILKIFVPKNVHMIVIDKHSVSPEQEEVLFGKNIRLQILKKYGDIVEVKMIN